ncbi:3'-5' exonuclease [Eisenibacter elegans]|uniref:3'-5' exonuclease n=1 Tax=Eisenibacter elegans TaxID=997 RepID=UPI0004135A79
MIKYLVFDLEMTGPEPGWNEIIQLGAVLCDENWNIQGEYLSDVYPENEESFSIPAQRIHDLTWDELQDAPMLHEVLEDFEDWILEKMGIQGRSSQDRKRLRSIVIGGQSVMYDVNFLRHAYKKEKRSWEFAYKQLDLHNLSFFLFEILKNNGIDTPRSLSLGAVAKFFGFEREGETHNALEDAILTAKCLQKVFAYTQTLKI